MLFKEQEIKDFSATHVEVLVQNLLRLTIASPRVREVLMRLVVSIPAARRWSFRARTRLCRVELRAGTTGSTMGDRSRLPSSGYSPSFSTRRIGPASVTIGNGSKVAIDVLRGLAEIRPLQT